MKRHRSLHPLSEHHHHALVQALEIRRAKQVPRAAQAKALKRAARAFLRHWKRAGRRHFREEEEVLLPAYARHLRLDRDRVVMRMLAQHAQIRDRVYRLEQSLSRREDVSRQITALGRLLHNHVRLEENRVFPRIEAALGEEGLAALGGKFSRLHGKGKP